MKKFVVLVLALFSLGVTCGGTELTETLNGVRIAYTYSGGMAVDLKLEKTGVSYRILNPGTPEEWYGPFPYKALQKENGEYFVAWFEEASVDYVSLVINFESKVLYGSALIGGKYTHFEKAIIRAISR